MYNDSYPFHALAVAIVRMAIKDYITAQKRLDEEENSGSRRRISEAEKEVGSIERFFKSEWCSLLCEGTIDGTEILQRLKRKEWRFDDEFGYVLCRAKA